MKKTTLLFLALILVPMVADLACADESARVDRFLLGTWTVRNETVDPTYSETTGQVTFFDDGSMTIDSGRFAAAGLVAEEGTFCNFPLLSISFKHLGKSLFAKRFLYFSVSAESPANGDPIQGDAMITILEHKRDKITMIGSGGCGRLGTPRISYLERIGRRFSQLPHTLRDH
jgi:hypothetical protein